MKKYVYIVIAKVYVPNVGEEEQIRAIFSNERKARAFVREYNKRHNWFCYLIKRQIITEQSEIKPFAIVLKG